MRNTRPAGSEDGSAPPAAILRRPASPLCDIGPAGTEPGPGSGPGRSRTATPGATDRRGRSEPGHGPDGAPYAVGGT